MNVVLLDRVMLDRYPGNNDWERIRSLLGFRVGAAMHFIGILESDGSITVAKGNCNLCSSISWDQLQALVKGEV